MLEQGKITETQHDAAGAPAGAEGQPPAAGCADAAIAPYFCDYVTHLILNNPAYGPDTQAASKSCTVAG